MNRQAPHGKVEAAPNLAEAIYQALVPLCDKVDGGLCLYPKMVYKKGLPPFRGLLRDMHIEYPPDAISAMIGGTLYVIEIPKSFTRETHAPNTVKFVIDNMDAFQSLLNGLKNMSQSSVRDGIV